MGGAHAVRISGTVHPTHDPSQLEPPSQLSLPWGSSPGVPAWGGQTRRALTQCDRVLACLHHGGSGLGESIILPSSPRGRVQLSLALGAVKASRGAGLGQAWAGAQTRCP